MKKLARYLICFIAGLLSGLLVILLFRNPDQVPLKDVKVTQISGENITHTSFDYNRKDRISFITEATGKGKALTEIPKTNIPEARAWMEKTSGVQGNVMYYDHMVFGISYWRRYGSFSVGAGLLGSTEGLGIQAGAQYWW